MPVVVQDPYNAGPPLRRGIRRTGMAITSWWFTVLSVMATGAAAVIAIDLRVAIVARVLIGALGGWVVVALVVLVVNLVGSFRQG